MISETLWYAFGIYLVGIGIVLYVRPEMMFGPGGVWREFGLSNNEDSTMFPFWLFAIVWAIMSYAIATMIMIIVAGAAVEEPEGLEIFSDPSKLNQVNQVNQLKPVSETNNFKKVKNSNKKVGYYVLNNSGDEPSYVFVGNKPPSEEIIEEIINRRN